MLNTKHHVYIFIFDYIFWFWDFIIWVIGRGPQKQLVAN
jgi:hypothetical protein